MRAFEPDYRNVEKAARGKRPPRLPFYEHFINTESMEAIDGVEMRGLLDGGESGRKEFFRLYCSFFKGHGYDTVSFEHCAGCALPDGGALGGHKPGAIKNRSDFEKYPWKDVPRIYWEQAGPLLDAMGSVLPPGMKIVGGVGNGVFEICQDLVGYENLCLVSFDDPELFAELFRRVGDLLVELWSRMLERHADIFAVCRTGDDMGFKTATLLRPELFRAHSVPQYARLVKLVHAAGKPYLLHSCGCIFDVMDDYIAAGIDAKHSNEDCIAAFDKWIELYGKRIGLFGGIDLDRLCCDRPSEIRAHVLEAGTRFRSSCAGYALGSGNSIPPYVPRDGYLAMLEAGEEIRRRESASSGA